MKATVLGGEVALKRQKAEMGHEGGGDEVGG